MSKIVKIPIECLKCGSSANIVAVDCGANHTVAMSSNGRVWCWGSENEDSWVLELHEPSGPESDPAVWG